MKTTAWIVLGVFAAAIVAGCQGDGGPGAPTNAPTNATPAAPPPKAQNNNNMRGSGTMPPAERAPDPTK